MVIRLARLLSVFCFTLLASCSDEEKPVQLTTDQFQKIETFVQDFESSLNRYEYDLFKSHWSSVGYIKNMGPLDPTEESVFRHFWKAEWKKTIENSNMDFINEIKYNNGFVRVTKVENHPDYVTFNLSRIIDSSYVDFIKWKVEYVKGTPMITDFYSYKLGYWSSSHLADLLKLASQYGSTHPERHKTYQAIGSSMDFINQRKYQAALNVLYEVPPSHEKVYNVGILKVQAAEYLDDETYLSVLREESVKNDYPYLSFQLAWNAGTQQEWENFAAYLLEETGDTASIVLMNQELLYWN